MFKISKYLAMICCSVSAFGTTIYDYENDYAMFNPVYRSICGDYENNCLKYYPNVLYTNEENIYKEIYKIFYTPDLNNIFFLKQNISGAMLHKIFCLIKLLLQINYMIVLIYII